MKKYKLALSAFLLLGLASCGNTNNKKSNNSSSEISTSSITSSVAPVSSIQSEASTTVTSEVSVSSSTETVIESKESSIIPTSTTESTTITNEQAKKTTVYLAADSTVKTYEEEQIIAGWGQYLDLFLDENVEVKNCAEGGRSARSFINEGRLYDIPGSTYSFSTNNRNSIGDTITEGDYLFIQFGHNDDESKSGTTLAERMVPVGTPDSNGIYPTTPGVKTPSGEVSSVVEEKMNAVGGADTLASFKSTCAKYGTDGYYEYSSGGTYKWFLKQYIDFAREKGATPVLVTPVVRCKFDGQGKIMTGAGYFGDATNNGPAYIAAVRQLAEEESCLLVDLYADSKTIMETYTSTYATNLMSLKNNYLHGTWPVDFDMVVGYDTTWLNSTAYNKAGNYTYTGMEATHYNKYGAFLMTGMVAEEILASTTKTSNNESFDTLKSHTLTTPEKYIEPSAQIPQSKPMAYVEKMIYKNVKMADSNRTDAQTSYQNDFKSKMADLKTYAESAQVDVSTLKTKVQEARVAYMKINTSNRTITDIKSLYTELTEYEKTVK